MRPTEFPAVAIAALLRKQKIASMPQLMAALLNTAIGLLRGAGYTNIAKACRHMAAQPAKALALVGIEFEN